MKIKGLRKFLTSIIAVAAFTAILMKNPTIDPFSLGLGMGFLLFPNAIANIFEYLKAWPLKK